MGALRLCEQGRGVDRTVGRDLEQQGRDGVVAGIAGRPHATFDIGGVQLQAIDERLRGVTEIAVANVQRRAVHGGIEQVQLRASDREMAKGDGAVVVIQGAQHPFAFARGARRWVLRGRGAIAANEVVDFLVGGRLGWRFNV
ncbi:hypothetical protein D3C73_1157030 [compost metagenome]